MGYKRVQAIWLYSYTFQEHADLLELKIHSLGRCVQSVEPRRVALMFNEHLLCARLFRTLPLSLAWSDEVSHSADEQTEATSIRGLHGG